MLAIVSCITNQLKYDINLLTELVTTSRYKDGLWQACDFLGFFWCQDFLQISHWKKRSSHQGKKVACIEGSLHCVQTLFVGMWRVCKSSKIKHLGGSMGFVLETKWRPRPATHLSGFFTFVKSRSVYLSAFSSLPLTSNHTSLAHSLLYLCTTFICFFLLTELSKIYLNE